MTAATRRGFTYHDVVEALDGRWKTTQEIALLGATWRAGSNDLRHLREALYALYLAGSIEHQPRHNGHLWRRVES